MLGPERSLPISAEFEDSESYVDALLEFVSSSDLLRTLCGGVHMLDFFTRIPDLYSQVLPQEWRSFFQAHDIMDILDLCMRENLDIFNQDDLSQWREGPVPPASLLQYIGDIRRYSLNREFAPRKNDSQERTHKLATNVALGMKVKKVHEVSEFASYVDRLTADIAETREQGITHIVDFGSGRNYLGRALASNPYNKHIIAVESRAHNIEGAKNFDERAELAPRIRPLRNKKEFRAQPKGQSDEGTVEDKPSAKRDVKGERRGVFARDKSPPPEPTGRATLQISAKGVGSIQYVEHYIKDGNLSRVIDQIVDQDAIRENVKGDLVEAEKGAADPFVQGNVSIQDDIKAEDPRLMVISLHSCGNLVHHGIRSLMLNPAVSAVALIGCCYNLITERLPPTQLPTLRTKHPRLEKASNTHDPHGFPMSERLCNYSAAPGKDFRLNITARMVCTNHSASREEANVFRWPFKHPTIGVGRIAKASSAATFTGLSCSAYFWTVASLSSQTMST